MVYIFIVFHKFYYCILIFIVIYLFIVYIFFFCVFSLQNPSCTILEACKLAYINFNVFNIK